MTDGSAALSFLEAFRLSRGTVAVLFVAFIAIGSGSGLSAQEFEDESVLWRAIADGSHIAIMRHAYAPRTGNKREFSLGDCATQRNLSQRGREQARHIGERLREHGIEKAAVYTSQWCRCRDTAELLQLSTVVDLKLLNSYFKDRTRGRKQTAQLANWLMNRQSQGPLILVTHWVNIHELTGESVSSGEIVVFRHEQDRSVSILGRIATPY